MSYTSTLYTTAHLTCTLPRYARILLLRVTPSRQRKHTTSFQRTSFIIKIIIIIITNRRRATYTCVYVYISTAGVLINEHPSASAAAAAAAMRCQPETTASRGLPTGHIDDSWRLYALNGFRVFDDDDDDGENRKKIYNRSSTKRYIMCIPTNRVFKYHSKCRAHIHIIYSVGCSRAVHRIRILSVMLLQSWRENRRPLIIPIIMLYDIASETRSRHFRTDSRWCSGRMYRTSYRYII